MTGLVVEPTPRRSPPRSTSCGRPARGARGWARAGARARARAVTLGRRRARARGGGVKPELVVATSFPVSPAARGRPGARLRPLRGARAARGRRRRRRAGRRASDRGGTRTLAPGLREIRVPIDRCATSGASTWLQRARRRARSPTSRWRCTTSSRRPTARRCARPPRAPPRSSPATRSRSRALAAAHLRCR